eukprot:2776109-Prymnesium_polylepis.1
MIHLQIIATLVSARSCVRMAAARVEEWSPEARRGCREVPPVDEVPIKREADDRRMARRAAAVVGRAVQALVSPVGEGIAMPVRLTAALAHMCLA